MKSIEVSIGGRKYPVKVTDEEEILVLDIVKEDNIPPSVVGRAQEMLKVLGANASEIEEAIDEEATVEEVAE